VLRQADAGFLEGVVRGYKNALLTQANYNNLTQCETLEGALRPFAPQGASARAPQLAAAALKAASRADDDHPSVAAPSDFRLQLSSTDYGNFLANEPLPLSTAAIADKASTPSS
jgi:V-type H+-transporting ATPase subunit d